jgi:hypothetical protein
MFLDQILKRLQSNAYPWGYNVFLDDRPLQNHITVMIKIGEISVTNALSGDRRMYDGHRLMYDFHIVSLNDTEQYELVLWEVLNEMTCKPVEYSHYRKKDGNFFHSIETYTFISQKWRSFDEPI